MIELECDTLAQWAEQCRAIELGELYDELRESLTRYQADYHAARARGRAGWADADKAVAEMIAVTALLGTLVDAMEWRRAMYASNGWRWPLVPL